MSITNLSVINAGDLDSIYSSVALPALREETAANTNRRQYSVTFRFAGFNSTTAEYLRTRLWVPRTDVVIRNARLAVHSLSAGLVVTASIPAQIISQERIVGGNLPYSLVGSATTSATDSAGTGEISSISGTAISTSTRLVALAGDNIEIIVSAPSGTACNAWVTLLVETIQGA